MQLSTLEEENFDFECNEGSTVAGHRGVLVDEGGTNKGGADILVHEQDTDKDQ